MTKIARFIVKNKLWLTIFFGVLLVASVICTPFVKVNYNDVKYLPKDSETSMGVNTMYSEFGSNGTCSVMLEDASVQDSIDFKNSMLAIKGVSDVVWIDDMIASVVDGAVKIVNESGGSISIGEGVGYLLDIFYALPDDVANLEFNELINSVAGLHTGTDYSLFLLSLVPVFQSGSFDMSLIKDFKPQLEGFYNRDVKAAFFQVFFDEGDYDDLTIEAVGKIRALSDKLSLSGQAANSYNSIQTVMGETTKAMIIAVVIVLFILFATSTSFWEPILYLIVIGVAVLINMGTNLLFGEISYMTQGVASILQLALTMDYSIFLLNRYKRERKDGKEVEESMIIALRKSISPISASSLTTIASFIALMFMKYKMGLDIGAVLTKGVILSIGAVFLLMPALIIYTHKLIEKSEHKSFNLSFKGASRRVIKSRYFLPFMMIAVIVPCAYFQGQNNFVYGSEASVGGEGSVISQDRKAIEAIFGKQNQLVILVPKSIGEEKELILSEKLLEFPTEEVTSVQSLPLIKQSGFDKMLPAKFLSQFEGEENYDRIILNLNMGSEGEEATAFIAELKNILQEEIGNIEDDTALPYYVLGESPATLDIKNIVEMDYNIITYISLALVGVVLLITYRSAILPALLLIVIEGSIWVNMTVPYVMGQPMVFIGYLLVSAILLGATIDYAILMTSNYLENRATMNKFDAAQYAMAQSARALLTSAGILTFAGFSIGIISTMPATSLFGMAIGRGGLVAFILVMFLLPQLLVLLDTPIRYTMYKGKKMMIDNNLAKPAPEIKSMTDLKKIKD